MQKLLQINNKDNIAIALVPIIKGEVLEVNGSKIAICEDVGSGHKIALKSIKVGTDILKYGYPIGMAVKDIEKGQWVHTHNLKTKLSDIKSYEYNFTNNEIPASERRDFFMGYMRDTGEAGTRNEIWIIPTVGCVNQNARQIAEMATKSLIAKKEIDGIFAFPHPWGCSQMGDDQENTQKILANLVNHPNAAGVLVLGLGCENNNVEVFKKYIGNYDENRVKFLVTQDVEDEYSTALNIIESLADYAVKFKRESIPVSKLKIGLKCGGSDGFSGITANPLVGYASDIITGQGGTTVLTEVPEMFGAEMILMERAANESVFKKIVLLINDFKEYYTQHNQTIYENPSPGNKEGGISSLEEKSLGCILKGGFSYVQDVINYADKLNVNGLNLLQGPGNDIISTTAMAAAGCQMIVFTTGRGTPVGTCVPTVKLSTNSSLYRHKNNWMDFNAGRLLEGDSMDSLGVELYEYLLKVASGEKTKNEWMNFREIGMFKTGVIL